MRRLSRINIVYPAFRFFQDLVLAYPIYAIMFRRSGVDFVGIGVLLAIWAFSVAILEVPSGAVADLWRRNRTLSVALLMKGLGFIVWLIRPDFFGFAVGFILWGFQEALVSGTTDALVFDALGRAGRAGEYETLLGRGAFWSRAGIIVSILVGGPLFSASRALVLALSAVSMIVAATLAWYLPDPRNRRGHADLSHRNPAETATSWGNGIGTEMKNGLEEFLRTPGLLPIAVSGAFIIGVWGVLDEYDFLFAEYRGVPLRWLGIWGVLRFGAEGIGAFLAGRAGFAGRRKDTPSVSRAVRAEAVPIAVLTIIGGAFLLLGTVTAAFVPLILYFGYYGMIAAVEVRYSGVVQRRITSERRATVSSIVSLVYTVMGMVLGVLVGLVADRISLGAVFPLAAVATITGGVFWWRVMNRWSITPRSLNSEKSY